MTHRLWLERRKRRRCRSLLLDLVLDIFVFIEQSVDFIFCPLPWRGVYVIRHDWGISTAPGGWFVIIAADRGREIGSPMWFFPPITTMLLGWNLVPPDLQKCSRMSWRTTSSPRNRYSIIRKRAPLTFRSSVWRISFCGCTFSVPRISTFYNVETV